MIEIQDWNSTGIEGIDKTGIVVCPDNCYIDYIVELESLEKGANAVGIIHQAATWQTGSKPATGTLVSFYETEEPLYRISVWKKYYFIKTLMELQLYYGMNEITAHSFVQNKAIEWLLK